MYYNRIGISEGIDLAKSKNSKKCMVFRYLFFNHGFKFRDSLCSGCYDLTILTNRINDIVIITVKNADYCCIIHNISKYELIDLLKNSVIENSENV